jgi:hypothetical protein
MIEVLWIDDEHNEIAMQQLKISAGNEGIRLNGYSSYEEGFEVLEKNLDRFDCILLDGMFFKKKGQEKGTEDTTGIGAAINHINKLSGKKEFPWYVLSGKDKFTSGENDLLKANEALCFDKTNPDDIERLFEEIKNVSENHVTFQIRKKYEDVLQVCEGRFLGQTQFSRIFIVLKCLEEHEPLESHLTEMRMVMEKMFERLHDLGLVPKESPNRTAWFLLGTHNNYRFKEEFIHPLFAKNVSHLLDVLQDGSHDKEELDLRVHDYIRTNSSHYFQRSIAYLFLDVLSGFRTLVKDNPNRETNLELWVGLEDTFHHEKDGEIINMAANNWITLKDLNSGEEISFPSRVVVQDDLVKINVGTQVWYKLKPNSNPSSKKHVGRIRLKQ